MRTYLFVILYINILFNSIQFNSIQFNGWMDGWMGIWINGWIDCIHISKYKVFIYKLTKNKLICISEIRNVFLCF